MLALLLAVVAGVPARATDVVLQAYGGAYRDDRLQFYVDGLAQALAPALGLPEGAWRVQVLNTPEINAFAASGARLYVTRGLLANVRDEAELAGVIGHELAHVAAGHAYVSAEHAGEGGFSPDQEFQADAMSVRALAHLGYDPAALADFLDFSRQLSLLEGSDGAVPDSVARSHPALAQRIARVRALSAQVRPQGAGQRRREALLRATDGMLFGADPALGVVMGNTLLDPVQGFAIDLPQGFEIRLGPGVVSALGPEGATVELDVVPGPAQGRLAAWLAGNWGVDLALQALQSFRVGPQDAATARSEAMRLDGPVETRLVAIRLPQPPGMRPAPARILRLLLAAPPGRLDSFEPAFNDTVFSLRPLSVQERARQRRRVLAIVTVRPGQDVASLAAGMPVVQPQARFRLMNGLGPRDTLRPGQRVRVVRAG
ncbi:M48 family metalloprotease [Zavarzinia sp. CC-PAN008]|uniref:M48 family metalloprotease n=1 Tax=Zavarzinia sp. CC-PAN008 TaxID=3243332 RepID=UPI003F7442C7